MFGDVNARADEIKAAVPALRAELDVLEQQLSSDFLTGDTVTAADLVVFAGVAFMVRGLTRPAAQPLELGLMPLAASWPRVQAWAARVEALPGIAETVPPHWHEGNVPWAGVS
jgi:glutathione S-transferase